MGGQPDDVKQTNTVELSPEQQKVFGLAMPSITKAAKSTPQVYSGSTVAGFNANDLAARAVLGQAATGTVGDLAASGATANQVLLDPTKMLSPDENPYVTAYGDTITRQLTENLQRNILPNISRQTDVVQGPFGATSRQGIREGIAIGDTAQAAGDALSKLYSSAYGQGLEAMGRGLALNPQTIASQLTSGQVLGALGDQERAIEQARLEEAASKFYFRQQLPFLKAQDLMAMVSGMPGSTGVSTVSGAMPRSSPVMGALGGAASGAALGSVIPGVGTAVGAGIGGLLGLFN